MSSDLDIGDVEKEQFNSGYSSSSSDNSKGSDDLISDMSKKEKEENKKNEIEGEGKQINDKVNEMISNDKKSNGQNIDEGNKSKNKSSKTNSKKSKSKNEENASGGEIKKSPNIQEQLEFNRFFIPQYNKRLETLMNIHSENSEEETNDNLLFLSLLYKKFILKK